MTTKLRVGLIGSGIAKSHIRAYQALPTQFEVVAICDIDEAKARVVAQEFNIPRSVTDLAELCQMDEVDVVDICTPSFLHYAHTLQALAAGKHVICEKPQAGSLKEIDELILAEAESDKRIMPIFQYRFGRGVQKLKFLMEKGLTGQAYLTTIETAWRRRPEYYAVPWRGQWDTELGGALVTLAIHAHDILTYVLGPAKRVLAQAATLVNPIETEDTLAISVQMADGSLASLAVTTGSSGEISRHRFCFEHLTAESHTAPYANTSDPWTFSGDSPAIEVQIEARLAAFPDLPEGYTGQFYRFHQALQNDSELPVTLHDARVSIELITAIYQATQLGCAVDLPLEVEHPNYSSWVPTLQRYK